ncbi:MAG TPA: glycosyltransferase family 2 protein [Edaphobacter sp.]|nr:glycosyltransferase family 2 protein [Edaphobacter sp.]
MRKSSDQSGRSVAVVIVNWNCGELLTECLKTVCHSDQPGVQAVVIDNGSDDGSLDSVRQFFPETHIIQNNKNLGFAKASNQGLEWAQQQQFPYMLLLNADTRIHPAMISELVAAAQRHNNTIAACPKIYQWRAPDTLWFAYGLSNLWTGNFSNPAYGRYDTPAFTTARDMGYASGCCILMPARVVDRVGLLDETLFAYCEDVDWSLRCRRAGFRLCYVPDACMWHWGGSPEAKKRPATYRYLTTRNQIWVLRRNACLAQFTTFIALYPLRALYRIIKLGVTGDWPSARAELRGAKDGFFSSRRCPAAKVLRPEAD